MVDAAREELSKLGNYLKEMFPEGISISHEKRLLARTQTINSVSVMMLSIGFD